MSAKDRRRDRPPGDRLVCLDSWAVLRWLEGSEPVASEVEELFSSAEGRPSARRPIMSWMNVGEVAYIVALAEGGEFATQVVDDLRRLTDLDEARSERVLSAAAIKAEHPMAFADAFAIATAQAHDAVLWTGDPEILDAGGSWEAVDLRGHI